MRTAALSRLGFATLVFGVSATTHPRFDWVDGLSDCWKQCLDLADDGCSSSKCICDAGQSDQYLPSAVECIYRDCSDGRMVGLGLLVPAQAYCAFAGNSIPDDVIKSAYAATVPRTSSAAPLTTRKVDDSPRSSTKHDGNAQLTMLYTTTFTQTSKDKNGNTLLIEIPIVMGPNTLSSGTPFTTTLEKQTSVSGDLSSSSAPTASPTSTPTVSTAPATSTQQRQAASSPVTAQPTERIFNSNGSPFENTNAAAGRWSLSGAAIGMGVIGGLFMRLRG